MKRIACCLAIALGSTAALADDHYVFVRQDSKSPPVLQVTAIDTTDVDVQVYGVPGGVARLHLGDPLFAAIDLTTIQPLQDGQVLLARVTSLTPLPTQVAVLTNHDLIASGPARTQFSPGFLFPVGDVTDGVSVVVGNPNGFDIVVDVTTTGFFGTPYTILANSAIEVPITTPNLRGFVASEGPAGAQPLIMAALLTHTKKGGAQMTMLPPF